MPIQITKAEQPQAADILDDPLLTKHEVAELLRIHPRTVLALASRQDNPLPSVSLPGMLGRRRFPRSKVAAWVQAGGKYDGR